MDVYRIRHLCILKIEDRICAYEPLDFPAPPFCIESDILGLLLTIHEDNLVLTVFPP